VSISTARRALLIGAAGLVLVASGACNEVDVMVARAGTAVEGGPEQPCTNNQDCLGDAYCSKPSCSELQGTCTLRPKICDNSLQTSCGCDGIIYWNDCLRQQNGVSASTPGECSGSWVACGGPHHSSCPTGTFCDDGLGDCARPSPGACWMLPDECPADAGLPPWHACGGGTPPCADLCSAIRSGGVYEATGAACPCDGECEEASCLRADIALGSLTTLRVCSARPLPQIP
jgi:hypothetical protein